MSHTIGQTTEDSQKSQVIQDSFPLEEKANSNVSLLSDADYEFLFNQLLEGVAHGWHDRRIIKFFEQLGDRGKQENWIAWLERIRSNVITLPLQSKRQLGTIMIRLGELTQSAPEVSKIGTVSNRIGRELLFGNTEDVVWEYVGPDLILDTPPLELETESDFSERLPENFDQLGMATVEDRVVSDTPSVSEAESTKEPVLESTSTDAQTETIEAIEDPFAEFVAEEELAESPLLDLDNLEDFPESIPTNDVAAQQTEVLNSSQESQDLSLELESADRESVSMMDELTVKLAAESEAAHNSENSAVASTFSDEFEFELDSEESELATEDLLQDVANIETSPAQDSDCDRQEQLLNLVDSPDSLDSAIDFSADSPPSEEQSDLDPVAIDAEQVMSLIQEDEQLAQQIAQKLNVSASDTNTLVEQSAVGSAISAPVDLNRVSIDLIEGWFNLGLKQVSGGEFDKAIASWEKALNINPNLSEAWHNRGSALGRLGKYEAAVESFQKALEIDPNNYQAWNDRAHALYQLKKWAAAADSWGNALKITPANHLFWYNRGCALEQLESWAESISSYEKALEIKPDFQPARSRYTNLIADNSRSN